MLGVRNADHGVAVMNGSRRELSQPDSQRDLACNPYRHRRVAARWRAVQRSAPQRPVVRLRFPKRAAIDVANWIPSPVRPSRWCSRRRSVSNLFWASVSRQAGSNDLEAVVPHHSGMLWPSSCLLQGRLAGRTDRLLRERHTPVWCRACARFPRDRHLRVGHVTNSTGPRPGPYRRFSSYIVGDRVTYTACAP